MSCLLTTLLFLGAAGTIDYEMLAVPSTYDNVEQPVRYYPAPGSGEQPLLVLLHTWSSDVEKYDPDDWVTVARTHGWHVIVPHFRGGNFNPDACASPAARQDILDATAYAIDHYDIDTSRIYLAGVSGGGHMAMVMAGHSPETWTAVSAWVGISNLTDWHAESLAAGRKYYKDIEASVGGAPGASPEVDEQLRLRSPVFFIANAKDIPLDLNSGIHDGHTGSVPIHHTLDAYNAVASAVGGDVIPPATIASLSQEIAPEKPPVEDPTYGRAIHLRKTAAKCRVTIFEGGHEGLPDAGCAWLAQFRK